MKLFCCSDLHSFYEPFKKALDEKCFEENNSEHLLLVLGDVFDRGPDSVQIWKYLDSLTNVILIRGNHEDLLEEMLLRGYGERHDKSNGTFRTVCDFADIATNRNNLVEVCKEVEKLLSPFLAKFIDYFETEHYIFVHSWLPCTIRYDGSDETKPWYTRNKVYDFMPDWREANEVEWTDARWGNPFELANAGLNKTGKTIVFGHWHTSWPRHQYENKPEFLDGADFSPYYGENFID